MAKTIDPTGKLTDKQAMFVREYLVDFSATEAAARAGYSPATAYSIGHENLTKPQITAAIAKLVAQRAKRLDVTCDRVIQGLAEIAFASIFDFIEVTPHGLVRIELSKVDQAKLGGVVEFACDTLKSNGREVVRTSIKMGDKLGALRALARYFNLTGNGNASALTPAQFITTHMP